MGFSFRFHEIVFPIYLTWSNNTNRHNFKTNNHPILKAKRDQVASPDRFRFAAKTRL